MQKKEINGKSGYFFVQKGSNYRERKKNCAIICKNKPRRKFVKRKLLEYLKKIDSKEEEFIKNEKNVLAPYVIKKGSSVKIGRAHV